MVNQYSGGEPHPEVFANPNEEDFKSLLAWVSGEQLFREIPLVELTNEEAYFADKIVPILERKTCFGCHLPTSFNDLKLDPGIPALEGRYTAGIHRKNRRAMLGDNIQLVNLSGEVRQSRQILKNIPVVEGGIHHKGGNQFLKTGDPDYLHLVEWLSREKKRTEAIVDHKLGEVGGYVFVRRSSPLPQRFFEDDDFRPGSELVFRKTDGEELILSAQLGQAELLDIRAPEVSFDGTSVAFEVRNSSADPINIWEVNLITREARQLTFSSDPKIHFREPLYIAKSVWGKNVDVDDVALVFMSNRAGGTAVLKSAYLVGETEAGSANEIVDLERTEKSNCFEGRTVEILDGANAGEVRQVASNGDGRIRVKRSFSHPIRKHVHYALIDEERVGSRYDLYRMDLALKGTERDAFARIHQLTHSIDGIRRPTRRSSGEIMFTLIREGWQGGGRSTMGRNLEFTWMDLICTLTTATGLECPFIPTIVNYPMALRFESGVLRIPIGVECSWYRTISLVRQSRKETPWIFLIILI